MKKSTREKLDNFLDSTLDAVLALLSLAVDAVFWIGWAYATKWSGTLISSLNIAKNEVWPYTIAQWAGCGVLALFALVRTLEDCILLCDRFIEFIKSRKTGN